MTGGANETQTSAGITMRWLFARFLAFGLAVLPCLIVRAQSKTKGTVCPNFSTETSCSGKSYGKLLDALGPSNVGFPSDQLGITGSFSDYSFNEIEWAKKVKAAQSANQCVATSTLDTVKKNCPKSKIDCPSKPSSSLKKYPNHSLRMLSDKKYCNK